jgi:2-polyprenyl-3-methyl-5-hydroxy-6-metoxy-1,4-benzoquinol methylase
LFDLFEAEAGKALHFSRMTSNRYTVEYFRARRMGESIDDPFDMSARALKGYRRGVRLLGDLRRKRVLDVGCGLGAGSWLLSEGGAHVTGIDVSADAIKWARSTFGPEAVRLGRKIRFQRVDLLDRNGYLGLGQFDALTVVDVLEHFTAREGVELLGRLRQLLSPSGRMFLHVPITANALDWTLVVKNGLLRKRLQGRVLDHHGDPTHAVRYSVHSLSRLLRKTGWTTEKLELRAYSPRLENLESAAKSGRWGLIRDIQQQIVTDWDGIHGSRESGIGSR